MCGVHAYPYFTVVVFFGTTYVAGREGVSVLVGECLEVGEAVVARLKRCVVVRLEYKNRLPTTLVDDVNDCAAAECGKHIARGDEVGAQNQRNPICFLDVADIFAFGGGEYEHVGRGFLIVKALGNPEIAVVVDVDVHNAVVAGRPWLKGQLLESIVWISSPSLMTNIPATQLVM